MTSDRPTMVEWKELYHAAAMFKEFAPWEWMEDSDIFGVNDPERGETGYCSVLGAGGELYGLLVYLGSEGLALLEGIQSQTLSARDEDFHAMQKCLALTFDDREMLDKNDLAIIKNLGLKFRGRQAWPSFRSHLPGFAPYYLNGSEARFLNLALRYSMGVAERLRKEPDLLVPPAEGSYLVGSLTRNRGGETWKDQWIKPKPFTPAIAPLLIDELRIARIKSRARKENVAWEIDFFFGPFTVEEGERPFVPYVALYAVHKEHHILGFTIAKHSEFPQIFTDNFLGTLEQIGVLPETVMVRKDAAHDLLRPILDRLGVKLRRAKSLKAVDDAKNSLLNSMSR
jgi:hypothetical protein